MHLARIAVRSGLSEPRPRCVSAVLVGALLCSMVALAPIARADVPTRTYTQQQTIPVPPASNFQGTGGGDGWAVALTPTGVYNVHHHNTRVTVACRKQADASQCWTAQNKTVTDLSGTHFGQWHPGLHLDQASGFLYVYAVRMSDGVGGIVCIDTAVADADPNPFCGFTPLTGPGESHYQRISNGVTVGSRFYAFNQDSAGQTAGARNKVLCFDVSTRAACPSQPFAVALTGSPSSVRTISTIDNKLIIPYGFTALACFDTATAATCTGSWPKAAVSNSGAAPFPLLDSAGDEIGICIPYGSYPCFDLDGVPVPTPAGLSSAMAGNTSYWNGPGHTIGSRVYVANGFANRVGCFDFASMAACANFPKLLMNQSLTYTVNPDPQRPTCLWTNADNGAWQIQNFDAFSGAACGEGPTRVLARGFLPPDTSCAPVEYRKLQVLDPARSAYSDGSVAFRDGGGNPMAGIPDQALDGTGSVDLTGLDIAQNGLPQFLITLNNLADPASAVTVEMTWVGPATTTCGGAFETYIVADPVLLRALPGPEVFVPRLTAQIFDEMDRPVEGLTLVFSTEQSQCEAVTDTSGRAECVGLEWTLAGTLEDGYNVSFAGTESYLSSTAHGAAIDVGSP